MARKEQISKSLLGSHLRNIVDLPRQPEFINSLGGGDCLHGGHYADDQVVRKFIYFI